MFFLTPTKLLYVGYRGYWGYVWVVPVGLLGFSDGIFGISGVFGMSKIPGGNCGNTVTSGPDPSPGNVPLERKNIRTVYINDYLIFININVELK